MATDPSEFVSIFSPGGTRLTLPPASPAGSEAGGGFLGQNQGLERRNASNTAAMNCIRFALSLASSLRSDPA